MPEAVVSESSLVSKSQRKTRPGRVHRRQAGDATTMKALPESRLNPTWSGSQNEATMGRVKPLVYRGREPDLVGFTGRSSAPSV